MNDSNKKNKPAVRFSGFTEDWEQRKLGELMNVTSVKRIHQEDWTKEGIRFLRARDIVAEYKNEDVDDKLYISKEKYDEYSAISGKVEIDDLLVTGVGTIGIPYVVKNLEPLYFKDGNIIWFQNKKVINGKFFFYSFCNDFIQNFIKKSAGTGTVGTYTIDSGKKTPIMLPTEKEEQEKLGEFFALLDNLLTLHQRECNQLKATKMSLIQKMFPKEGEKVPEIRFSGFTEAWEQCELNQVVDIYDGVHKTPAYTKNGVMFLSVENIATLESNKYISEEDFIRDYKVFPQKGDILMTRIGDVGTPHVVESSCKLAYYVSLALLKPKKINSYYLNSAIQSSYFQQGLRNRTLLTAVPMKINKDEIGKVNIMYPSSLSEQQKIGQVFTSLDKLLTLHQRKCEQLKAMKTALLQKMFV